MSKRIDEIIAENQAKVKWFQSSEHPSHKDLVLVDIGIGFPLPAIYYSNNSFKGFWKFTTFYTSSNTLYNKTKLKRGHEIKGVIQWCQLPEILTTQQ